MVKKTEIKEKISIPENITATLESNILTLKGEKGELSRKFTHPKIDIKIDKNLIEINGRSIRRKEKALIGTFIAHINNMIRGVTEGFEYKMKTVFSHFPIKTSVDGNEFVIENFLGERSARRAKILEGINVEVIDPRTLYPLDKKTIFDSLKKTGRLIIVEEAPKTGGVGAEISAIVNEEAFDHLDAPIRRVAAPHTPIPASYVLENLWIPDVPDIIEAAKQTVS